MYEFKSTRDGADESFDGTQVRKVRESVVDESADLDLVEAVEDEVSNAVAGSETENRPLEDAFVCFRRSKSLEIVGNEGISSRTKQFR